MEKFSNDLIENVAINALTAAHDWGIPLNSRFTMFKTTALRYITNEKKWRWELIGGVHSKKLNWTDEGIKEEIIQFLCKAKPDFERELLRAKSELDLTKKTVYAL